MPMLGGALAWAVTCSAASALGPRLSPRRLLLGRGLLQRIGLWARFRDCAPAAPRGIRKPAGARFWGAGCLGSCFWGAVCLPGRALLGHSLPGRVGGIKAPASRVICRPAVACWVPVCSLHAQAPGWRRAWGPRPAPRGCLGASVGLRPSSQGHAQGGT